MANKYLNAFYEPTTTGTPETVYTCPTETTAIFQTLQITSTGTAANGSVYITQGITDYRIAYAEISGPTICNLLKGSIVLVENDVLKIETSATTGISAVGSLLETTRVYIASAGGIFGGGGT